MPAHPPSSTLFPYTTLFRSEPAPAPGAGGPAAARRGAAHHPCDRLGPRLCTHTRRHPSRYQAREHRSEEHTSELQSHSDLVCRLLLEKKKHKQENKTIAEHT